MHCEGGREKNEPNIDLLTDIQDVLREWADRKARNLASVKTFDSFARRLQKARDVLATDIGESYQLAKPEHIESATKMKCPEVKLLDDVIAKVRKRADDHRAFLTRKDSQRAPAIGRLKSLGFNFAEMAETLRMVAPIDPVTKDASMQNVEPWIGQYITRDGWNGTGRDELADAIRKSKK